MKLRRLSATVRDRLTPRTPKGRRTHLALTRAARRAFARKGYRQTGVTDIASAARVSHGVFYRYFRNKRDILLELLDQLFEETGQIMQASPETGDPGVLTTDLVERYYVHYRKNADLYRVLVETAQSDKEISRRWHRTRSPLFQEVLGYIERGHREGAVRDDVDAELAAWFLVSMVDHYAYLWFVLKREPARPIREVATRIGTLWRAALSK